MTEREGYRLPCVRLTTDLLLVRPVRNDESLQTLKLCNGSSKVPGAFTPNCGGPTFLTISNQDKEVTQERDECRAG